MFPLVQYNNIHETIPIIMSHFELIKKKIIKLFPVLNIQNYK